MGGVGDVLSGAASQVGRYFSVLTVLPSALLVSYVYALVTSGAWSGVPDWGAAAESLGGLGLGEIAQLALVSLLIGLVLHPLQFALVQFLEGYWGTSRPAVRAMASRMRHHRRRFGRLHTLRDNAVATLEDAGQLVGSKKVVADAYVDHLVLQNEAARLIARYPDEPNHIRPTRLGNALRRYEVQAGRQYGLSAVVVPHVAHVAPRADVAYLNDQRTSLDLAVRLVVVAALATCASVLFLWRAGPWLLLALAPYTLTYVFYRGAVVAAGGYGIAFSALIDLNRFTLYERLGLGRPETSFAEREQNRQLMLMLRRSKKKANVAYAPPSQRPPP